MNYGQIPYLRSVAGAGSGEAFELPDYLGYWC